MTGLNHDALPQLELWDLLRWVLTCPSNTRLSGFYSCLYAATFSRCIWTCSGFKQAYSLDPPFFGILDKPQVWPAKLGQRAGAGVACISSKVECTFWCEALGFLVWLGHFLTASFGLSGTHFSYLIRLFGRLNEWIYGKTPGALERAWSMVCACVLSCFSRVQLFVTLDCSLPGSSVHGILQPRILEWVAMPFFSGSSQPLCQTHISYVSCIGKFFTAESLGRPLDPW